MSSGAKETPPQALAVAGSTSFYSDATCQGILAPTKLLHVTKKMAVCHDGTKGMRIPLDDNGCNPIIITIDTAGHILDKHFNGLEMEAWSKYQ